MAENAVEQLDLVRENQRLRFPDNVTLNFVYWRHIIENLPDIRPYLLQADAIAIESYDFHAPEGFTAKTAGRHMRRVVDHIVQGIASDEEYEFLGEYDDFAIQKTGLIASLPKKPRVFFVDNYANAPEEDIVLIDDLSSGQSYGRGSYVEDLVYMSSELDFRRESAALTQLAAIANKIGKDGDSREIAVLYGANHRLLSVAAKAFGANVVRHSVHMHSIDRVTSVAGRLIRFGMLPDLAMLSDDDLLTIKAATEADIASGVTRYESGPLMSAAMILRAVSKLDGVKRQALLSLARDINTNNDIAHEKHGRRGRILKKLTKPKTKRLILEDILDGSMV